MNKAVDLEPVKAYFARCLEEHGESPRGVDWNSEAAQDFRFRELLRLVDASTPFSLLDYGSGYGAMADYMDRLGIPADYFGYDIVEEAIQRGRRKSGARARVFFGEGEALPTVDYVVASGTFNVRGETSFDDWTAYVIKSLSQFDALSRKGFASNFLTKYSDADRMKPHLYYADPGYLFDYAKRNFSRNVALLHDYNAYDFTLIVRKLG